MYLARAGKAAVVLVVLGSAYLRSRGFQTRGLDIDPLRETLGLIVFVSAVLVALEIVIDVNVLLRERALIRMNPTSVVIFFLKPGPMSAALRRLPRPPMPLHNGEFFGATGSISADDHGISLWRGVNKPVAVWFAAWSEVTAIEHSRTWTPSLSKPRTIVMRFDSPNGEIEVPFVVLRPGSFFLGLSRRHCVRLVSDLERLRRNSTAVASGS